MENPLLPVSSPAAGEEPPASAPSAQPEPSPSPATFIPISVVFVRVASFVALSLLSVWANHEVSRGFSIDVVNAAAGSPAGRRFDLMFSSNGRASRSLLDASHEVERTLYPGGATTKRVQHVTLRLVDENMSAGVVVDSGGESKFVLRVSSDVMLATDAKAAMRAAVCRGMARVWLWDGQGKAPEALLDAMAEYLAMSVGLDGAASRVPVDSDATSRGPVGSGAASDMGKGGEDSLCWPEAAPGTEAAVRFVRLCEAKSSGFVARLNSAMREGWRPGMVEEAIGSTTGRLSGTQVSASTWGCKTTAASPTGKDLAGWSAGRGHVTSQA